MFKFHRGTGICPPPDLQGTNEGQKYADQKIKRANMKLNFMYFKINQYTMSFCCICFWIELGVMGKIGLVCLLYISSSSKLNCLQLQNVECWWWISLFFFSSAIREVSPIFPRYIILYTIIRAWLCAKTMIIHWFSVCYFE